MRDARIDRSHPFRLAPALKQCQVPQAANRRSIHGIVGHESRLVPRDGGAAARRRRRCGYRSRRRPGRERRRQRPGHVRTSRPEVAATCPLDVAAPQPYETYGLANKADRSSPTTRCAGITRCTRGRRDRRRVALLTNRLDRANPRTRITAANAMRTTAMAVHRHGAATTWYARKCRRWCGAPVPSTPAGTRDRKRTGCAAEVPAAAGLNAAVVRYARSVVDLCAERRIGACCPPFRVAVLASFCAPLDAAGAIPHVF